MERSITLGYTRKMSVLWFISGSCQYTRLYSIDGRSGEKMERSVSTATILINGRKHYKTLALSKIH
jgi:hypothetical protein